MARNIRWYFAFKSQNGTACRVNIFDNDWPEGFVQPLTGAADPFYYEEENSSDLLDDVLRYRTGYIRVVEPLYGSLDAIYPSSIFDRYVEFWYGEHLDFTGYIQMQDFGSTLERGPRVIELPVISPMGLWDKVKFTTIMPPTTKTLGQLLDIVLDGQPRYTKVTCPDISGVGLWQTVYSLVVSPWNDDYHHSMNVNPLQKIMEPETFSYLIECICKAFGWICHDTPQALIFTSFDYSNRYVYYDIGHIGETNYKHNESVDQGPFDVADYYTFADDSARLDTLLPETGVEVEYEGHLGHVDITFDRTYFVDIVTFPGMSAADGEKWSLCNLFPVGVINEVTLVGTATFQGDGKVTIGQYVVAWNGNIGVLCSLSSSYSSGHTLFTIKHYEKKRTGRSWGVTYSGMSSQYSIGALEDDELIFQGYINTSIVIYDDYVEVTFSYHYGGNDHPQLPSNYLIFIHNIRLEMYEDNEPYADYRYTPANDADLLPSSSSHPVASASVTMPISLYRNNDRMIGDTLRSTKVTEYPYLMGKRWETEGKFRAAVTHSPDIFHTRLWEYLGKKWRIISQTFHPWDDEYTLTMQSSGIFDIVTYTVVAVASNTSLAGYYATIEEGDPVHLVLTPNTNYRLTSVLVTMGTSDITSTAYDSSTGEINISHVTGYVTITAVAVLVREYDVLEYIAVDQEGYYGVIDTGITGSKNIKIEADYMLTAHRATISQGNALFGAEQGFANNSFTFLAEVNAQGRAYFCIGNASKQVNGLSLNTKYHVDAGLTFTLNGNTQTSNPPTFSTPQTIRIFTNGRIGYADTTALFLGRLYSLKIYNGSTLVRDFEPRRRNSDNMVSLYDTVNDTFYLPDNGISYVAGPVAEE